MMHVRWSAWGSLLAAAAVALGAFGAHGLKGRLDAASLEAFEVGVRYQMYHALGLLAIGCVSAQRPSRWTEAGAVLMLFGTVLFSGSLYGLTLMGWKWLGPVTPLGGVILILSWVVLAATAWSGATATPQGP